MFMWKCIASLVVADKIIILYNIIQFIDERGVVSEDSDWQFRAWLTHEDDQFVAAVAAGTDSQAVLDAIKRRSAREKEISLKKMAMRYHDSLRISERTPLPLWLGYLHIDEAPS